MLARELAVQARAAEDSETQVALVGAFQKTSRTVRLTLALDFKLQRDAARATREDAAAEAKRAEREQLAALPAPAAPRQVRKDRARKLLNRLIWNEAEGDSEEYDILHADLSARLDEAAEAEGFEDLPIEVVARQVAKDMGLSGTLTFTGAIPAVRPATADSG
jgi:hypothetical protein